MSILDLALDKVPDLTLVPEGEHEFRVTEVDIRDSQATPGNKYINLTLQCLDVPNTARVYNRLHLPNGQDVENDNSKKRRISSFVRSFEVPTKKGNLDTDDVTGRTGIAIVRHEINELSGEPQVTIRRYVVQK